MRTEQRHYDDGSERVLWEASTQIHLTTATAATGWHEYAEDDYDDDNNRNSY